MHIRFPGTCQWVIGIDEVGRGPIAGPVMVGLCMMSRDKYVRTRGRIIPGITDSKKLTPKKREELSKKILADRRATTVVVAVSATVIESKGIASAIRSAIEKGLKKIMSRPTGTRILPERYCILLDGALRAPEMYPHQKTIIKGDLHIPLISMASIVAKVERDAYMTKQAKKYPQYGFERHKGYGTRDHYQAIKKRGLSSLHRKSWIRLQ